MKFNCGPTKAEKRDSKLKASYDKNAKRVMSLTEWHRVFAWWPVRTIDNVCCWLEYVERSYQNAYVGKYYDSIYTHVVGYCTIKKGKIFRGIK